MTMTQDAVDRTMMRLAELHATLAADEQEVLGAILRQAGDADEVTGFMPSTSDSRFIKITANTAAGAAMWSFAAVLDPPSTAAGDYNSDGRAEVITGSA